MADSNKLVIDLLPLGFELKIVGEYLPLATSAGSEVFAEWFKPAGRGLDYAHYASVHEGFLALSNHHIDHIARNCEGYEQHPGSSLLGLRGELGMRQRLALGSHSLDGDVLQYDSFFTPSCHPCAMLMIVLRPVCWLRT